MSNADVVFVQGVFSKEQTQFYMPAAMIGLALITFAGPLAAVMFPKIVRSAALTQDTRALRQALTATVLICGIAALACTVAPWLPVRVIFFRKHEYWAAAPLVPWFAWCLLPLIVSNVLVSNLLARERFAVAPWALLIAAGYGVALGMLKPHLLQMEVMTAFRTVIQTLGVFSLLLLAVSAGFTWREKGRAVARGL
jgi:O-antigen/teichoic acid export membrane protein